MATDSIQQRRDALREELQRCQQRSANEAGKAALRSCNDDVAALQAQVDAFAAPSYGERVTALAFGATLRPRTGSSPPHLLRTTVLDTPTRSIADLLSLWLLGDGPSTLTLGDGTGQWGRVAAISLVWDLAAPDPSVRLAVLPGWNDTDQHATRRCLAVQPDGAVRIVDDVDPGDPSARWLPAVQPQTGSDLTAVAFLSAHTRDPTTGLPGTQLQFQTDRGGFFAEPLGPNTPLRLWYIGRPGRSSR